MTNDDLLVADGSPLQAVENTASPLTMASHELTEQQRQILQFIGDVSRERGTRLPCAKSVRLPGWQVRHP